MTTLTKSKGIREDMIEGNGIFLLQKRKEHDLFILIPMNWKERRRNVETSC
jgi:hypothetical protein